MSASSPESHETHGGVRAGAGRPARPDIARVALSCRVRPETLAALRAAGPLLGQSVDALVLQTLIKPS